MTSYDLSTLAGRRATLAVAETAARAAGDILMEHLGRLKPSEISSKQVERDLLTKADVASERCLVEHLRRAFPEHAIEAEEEVHDALDEPTESAGTGEPGAPGAPAVRPRWFLDPLDGTINFVHEIPAFAVSMGLYLGGQPQVAVVHAPRLGETFTAVRGGGAYLGQQPLAVSRTERLGLAILATGFPYRRGELEHDNLANFGRFFYDVRGMRRLGSAALDLAYVAAGRFDGYWELHLAPHDVAGGALLVREAGGVVTDADGGEDWLRGGHLVASGPALHETLRARIAH